MKYVYQYKEKVVHDETEVIVFTHSKKTWRRTPPKKDGGRRAMKKSDVAR